MKRTFLAPVLVCILLSVLAGCEDLGKCKNPDFEGRIPVVDSGGRVMYTGQAILLTSCANGCHSSKATGELRQGAPHGLDFDIQPLEATATGKATDSQGKEVTVGTTTDSAGLSGLRSRQRKVFDEREGIWQQVLDGLMPPPGIGAAFRNISNLSIFSYGEPDGSCPIVASFDAVNKGPGREALREWLACGAPIVEINAPHCEQVMDAVCLPKAVAGTVGDQFPSCPVQLDPTFENVYNEVFVKAGTCTVSTCHASPGAAGLDLGTIDIAYTALVGDDGNGAPATIACPGGQDVRVVPNDPDASNLVARMEGNCGLVMPPAGTLPQPLLDLVRAWISAGAPGPGEGGSTPDAGM